jgi:phosphatidate cytidylyltransferase
MKRVLTALALLPIAIYGTFFAPYPVFLAIVLLMAALCYHEYAGIARATGIEGPLWVGHAAGAAVVLAPDSIRLSVLIILTVALTSRELAKMLGFAGAAVFGVLYVHGAWRCAVDLRAIPTYGIWWLLFALSVNWAGDIAAYYVGRAIGKHKLAPRISPSKSWEGAIASLVGAVALGVAMQAYGLLDVSLASIITLSMLANAAGQIGDLVESAMKRGAGVKDSGTLLPGHGGFLDRLDSSLFTLPAVYFYLALRVYS